MNQPLTIAQLYPDLLGLTGDRGNTEVLSTRARRAGLDVRTVFVGRDESLPAADVYVIGNGPFSAMKAVVGDLRRHTRSLSDHVDRGGALLAVGGGAELLSREVSLSKGDLLEGLGIFSFRTEHNQARAVGYLVVDSPAGRLAGFEDHASLWRLADGGAPYARVVEGQGCVEMADGSRGEGFRIRNAIGVRMQGPVLPLNPSLADTLLEVAARAAGMTYAPGEAHANLDAFAREARAAIETRARSKVYATIGI